MVIHEGLVHRADILEWHIGADFTTGDHSSIWASQVIEHLSDMLLHFARRCKGYYTLAIQIGSKTNATGKIPL